MLSKVQFGLFCPSIPIGLHEGNFIRDVSMPERSSESKIYYVQVSLHGKKHLEQFDYIFFMIHLPVLLNQSLPMGIKRTLSVLKL